MKIIMEDKNDERRKLKDKNKDMGIKKLKKTDRQEKKKVQRREGNY